MSAARKLRARSYFTCGFMSDMSGSVNICAGRKTYALDYALGELGAIILKKTH